MKTYLKQFLVPNDAKLSLKALLERPELCNITYEELKQFVDANVKEK